MSTSFEFLAVLALPSAMFCCKSISQRRSRDHVGLDRALVCCQRTSSAQAVPSNVARCCMHATTSTFLQSARGSRGDMVQWHATGPGCISHIGCYVLTCLTGIRSVRAPRAARWAAIDRGAERCRFQQFLVLDFPRPRSERGVSWCGGMRAAQGTDGTSAATYRPFRPESEALGRRACQTVPQPGLQVQQAQQFLVLDFPRPRSGRGVSWCGGVRAPRGADDTSRGSYCNMQP